MSIIDTPDNTESSISCLVSRGVSTVIRYYNFSNSRTFPRKRMELAEAQALSAQGLQIAAVFQQRQDRPDDFTEQKGFEAGRRAHRHARENIGQPVGSGIYFSADFDASEEVIRENIVPYFEGVRRAFEQESGGGASYRVGLYGSGLTSTTLTQRGLIELVWLAMSRGFRGTRAALSAGEFHLAQRTPETRLCGLDVDFNDPNPARPDFGAFNIDHEAERPDPVTALGERHKVIARTGLRLREGPGSQFDVVGGLRPGQIVFVRSINDGFAQIDVEGDGQIDGFASAGFLERV